MTKLFTRNATAPSACCCSPPSRGLLPFQQPPRRATLRCGSATAPGPCSPGSHRRSLSAARSGHPQWSSYLDSINALNPATRLQQPTRRHDHSGAVRPTCGGAHQRQTHRNPQVIAAEGISSVPIKGQSSRPRKATVDHYLLLLGSQAASAPIHHLVPLETCRRRRAFVLLRGCVGVFAPFTPSPQAQRQHPPLFSFRGFPRAISDPLSADRIRGEKTPATAELCKPPFAHPREIKAHLNPAWRSMPKRPVSTEPKYSETTRHQRLKPETSPVPSSPAHECSPAFPPLRSATSPKSGLARPARSHNRSISLR